MSKSIRIKNGLYEKLKSDKGERSFSERIEELYKKIDENQLELKDGSYEA